MKILLYVLFKLNLHQNGLPLESTYRLLETLKNKSALFSIYKLDPRLNGLVMEMEKRIKKFHKN